MSMLTEPRNTAEIPCHSQKIHRVFPVVPGKELFAGAITALNPEFGTVEPASNTPGLIVLGRCEGFTNSGKAIIKTGIFKYDNARTKETALTLHDINRICYVYDDHTVGNWTAKNGFTNVIAGVVRNIDYDGQVIVEVGNFVRE